MCCHAVVLAIGVLTTGTQAFAPIHWMGAPSGGLTIMPKASSGNVQALSPPQDLIVGQPGTNSPNTVPHFTAKADNTITWDGMEWCVEADGRTNGDAVRVNECNGGPAQRWNWIPDGRGRYMIQLQDSKQCLDVKEGGLSGAPIALQDCANQMTNAWKFEESLPLRTHVLVKSLGSDMRHAMVSLLALAGSGLLGIGVWLWRSQNKACMVTAGHGDVSMAMRASNGVRPTATVMHAGNINMMADTGEPRELLVGNVRRAGNISMMADNAVHWSEEIGNVIAEANQIVGQKFPAVATKEAFKSIGVESTFFDLDSGVAQDIFKDISGERLVPMVFAGISVGGERKTFAVPRVRVEKTNATHTVKSLADPAVFRAFSPTAASRAPAPTMQSRESPVEKLLVSPEFALAFGSGLLLLLLTNRFSMEDLPNSQSRADLIATVAPMLILLKGVSTLDITPKRAETVPLDGVDVAWVEPSMESELQKELDWAADELMACESCAALAVYHEGRTLLLRGKVPPIAGEGPSQAVVPGPLLEKCMLRKNGAPDYLPALQLLPGRVEFGYFPLLTQGVLMLPFVGTSGALILACDRQRGFGQDDVAWARSVAGRLGGQLIGDTAT